MYNIYKFFINFTSLLTTLNIAVFSYDSYNPSSMTYTIYHSIPMRPRYSYSGSVIKNNDTSLDDGEFDSFLFEMATGSLDLRVITTANLGVLICNCSDITIAQERLNSSSLGDDEYFFETETNLGVIIQTDSRTDYNVYVYSLSGHNGGSFNIISTRQEGDTIDDTPVTQEYPSDSGDGSSGMGILITLAIILIIGFIMYKKVQQKTKKNQSSINQNWNAQSYRQQPQNYYPGGEAYLSEQSTDTQFYERGRKLPPNTKVCSCKALSTGSFCSNCGSKL